MNQQRTFVRKMVYVAIIAVLLVPLYLLSHPETQDSPGGVLAQMRQENGLSESKLGGVDPASNTAKLATFGMRGVATTMLWQKKQEYQAKKLWTELDAVLKQIMLLQPHFIKVWENQTWNLAYNVSAEFDDYKERYRWVIEGINFGVDGTTYNEHSARLPWYVGWVISQKIGRADESKQFRRMFHEDEAFHTRHNILEDEARDNWLVGKDWFLRSEDMVEQGADIGNKSMVLFYSRAPMSQMNYSEAYVDDGNFGEKARNKWKQSFDEWIDYGSRQVPSTTLDDQGELIYIALNDLDAVDQEIQDIQQRMADMSPGLEDKVIWEKWERLTQYQRAALLPWLEGIEVSPTIRPALLDSLVQQVSKETPDWKEQLEQLRRESMTPEQLTAYDVAPRLRNQRESELVDQAMEEFYSESQRALSLITVTPSDIQRKLPSEFSNEAAQCVQDLDRLAARMKIINNYRGLVSFPYWKNHADSEQTVEARGARENIFEARKAYYEGELLRANELYLKGLSLWNDLLANEDYEFHEYLVNDTRTTEDLMDLVQKYSRLLEDLDEQYPEDFPLQELVRRNLNTSGSRESLTNARISVAQGDSAREAGDLKTAQTAYYAAASDWAMLFMSVSYLDLMPDRVIGNEIIDSTNRLAQVLIGLNEPMPTNYPLADMLNTQVRFDPRPTEARRATASADTEFAESKLAEAQANYEKAINAWAGLLDSYQMLYVGLDPGVTLEIQAMLDNYAKTLQLRGQQVPSDFPLRQFLEVTEKLPQAGTFVMPGASVDDAPIPDAPAEPEPN